MPRTTTKGPDQFIKHKRATESLRRLRERQKQAGISKARIVSEQQKRETIAARGETAKELLEQRRVQKVQTQADLNAAKIRQNRSQAIQSAGLGAAKETVSFGGGKNTLFLLTGLFFTMIIVYVIVHNGEQFGGLLSGVSTFITGLSSNGSLFVKKPATTAS